MSSLREFRNCPLGATSVDAAKRQRLTMSVAGFRLQVYPFNGNSVGDAVGVLIYGDPASFDWEVDHPRDSGCLKATGPQPQPL